MVQQYSSVTQEILYEINKLLLNFKRSGYRNENRLSARFLRRYYKVSRLLMTQFSSNDFPIVRHTAFSAMQIIVQLTQGLRIIRNIMVNCLLLLQGYKDYTIM